MLTVTVILATPVLQRPPLLPLLRMPGSALRDCADGGAADARQLQGLAERLGDGDISIAAHDLEGRDDAKTQALRQALSAQRRQVECRRERGRLGETPAEQLATELDLDAMGITAEGNRLTDAGEA